MIRILLRAGKKYSSVCSFTGILFLNSVLGQSVTLRNQNLQLDINPQLQTRILAHFPGSSQLVVGYSNSEFLETKYFSAKEFSLIRKEKSPLHDAAGTGTQWRFFGTNHTYQIEKIFTVKLYDHFPDAAYISVDYINHGNKNLTIKKWVNNAYDLIPSADKNKF